MTSFVAFQPTAIEPFQFNATLDKQTYSVLITWNLSGQRYYINIHDQDQNLIISRPMTESPDGFALSSPPSVFRVALMNWGDRDGGTLSFVLVDPLPIEVKLGSTVVVSGATNFGSAGNGAVNGSFIINELYDPFNFTAILTASEGDIGAIGGTVVVNALFYALRWQRGIVIATAKVPHNIPLGAIFRATTDNVVPDAYNGVYYAVVTSPTEFRFQLSTDPGGPATRPGNFFIEDVNLVDGYFSNSSLVYRGSSRQFEIRP